MNTNAAKMYPAGSVTDQIGKSFLKVVRPMIPSLNSIVCWLKEIEALRQAQLSLAA